MKTIREFDLRGKRVLVRVDFNEPVDEEGNPQSDYRIRSTLPTLRYLIGQDCTLVLLTHIGRPEGQVVGKYRTTGVARCLEEQLSVPVKKLNDCVGETVKTTLNRREARVYFLENLRFHPEEEGNDPGFAKQLAALGDFYVNDAFANCHRAHASMVGILKFLPGAAGLLLEKEISALGRMREHPVRPFTFVLGGAKLETKLKLLKLFMQRADTVLIGGEIANTLLKASGADVGASKVSNQAMKDAITLVPKIADAKMLLPIDVCVSRETEAGRHESPPADARICEVKEIREGEIIYDIGPRTVQRYAEIIKQSKQVLWNGPMGYFEHMYFRAGTQGVVDALIATPAQTIVGGGETVDFLEAAGARDRVSFVSTGGGAMLDFLADGRLVAVEALA